MFEMLIETVQVIKSNMYLTRFQNVSLKIGLKQYCNIKDRSTMSRSNSSVSTSISILTRELERRNNSPFLAATLEA